MYFRPFNLYTLAQKICISVTSDLVTDQRVHRTAITLHEKGYDVLLIGRKKKDSKEIEPRPYTTLRFKLWFETGALFYLNYNVRLFWFLLTHSFDIYFANDLDTLLANTLASRIKKRELIYDSHEYFTEVPELLHRPFIKNIWMKIEKFCMPSVKKMTTVNDSIADVYRNLYKREIDVVRNVPLTQKEKIYSDRKSLGLPLDKHLLIFQGAGININRGGEEAVEMMQYLEDAILLFVGGGDVINTLKRMTEEKNLFSKVIFMGKVPFEKLRAYTSVADIGLSLDKDISLNYRYSLPNKLFDYIHSGLPVLASDLPEVKKIVTSYNVGRIVDNHQPETLALTVKQMLEDKIKLAQWKQNAELAAKELCWENEQKKLLHLFNLS